MGLKAMFSLLNDWYNETFYKAEIFDAYKDYKHTK